MILRPSYLHNGISYTGKTTSLYWIRALIPILFMPSSIDDEENTCRCPAMAQFKADIEEAFVDCTEEDLVAANLADGWADFLELYQLCDEDAVY